MAEKVQNYSIMFPFRKKRKYPPQVVPNIKDSHSLLSCSSISTLNRPLPCHMRISVRAIGPLLCQLEMSCFRHHFWVSHSVRGRTAPEVRPVVFSHLAEAVQGGGVSTSEETLGKPVDMLEGFVYLSWCGNNLGWIPQLVKWMDWHVRWTSG